MNGLQIWKEFGLLGLVVGAGVIILAFVIKWVLDTTKEIMKQAAEERKIWNDTVNKAVNTIDRHDEKADERAKYVREEHKQMIEILGRINEYQK